VADPLCGFTFDGVKCRRRGPHRCTKRVEHVLAFFSQGLTHTKGEYARKPFVPAPWQRDRVLAPLFGEVLFDEKRQRYVRRYRTLYLCIGRKNGKSELIAGIMLYLLVADGEIGAEVYGLALDTEQAGIVYHVAQRMVRQNADLRDRLRVVRSVQRIVDETTGSYYQVLAGDAAGNLGLNPSGAVIDELLNQPDRELFDAIRTGFGARAQPLLMLATTAENDPTSFAATERSWSERIAEDPDLEPERLVVIYSAPVEADWTAPETWKLANPALGDFLDMRVLAAECHTAQGNPAAERSFRQYRLNQPQTLVGRAIALSAWEASAGPVDCFQLAEDCAGREAYIGLDLATTQDLAAYALVFPSEDENTYQVVWRHFAPARQLTELSRRTGGQAMVWVTEGLLTLTDSAATDYRAIAAALEADRERYRIAEVAYDPWNSVQLATELSDGGWPMIPMAQSARSLSAATSELLRLIAEGDLHHGGSPIMRWQAGNAVTRVDPVGNVKLDKQRSIEKIDGLVATVMGLDRAMRHTEKAPEYAACGFN
jgi:phage terminase large subunit-like protein